ncbi:MAG TPA: ThiF family adenylyltransferase [Planctomycetota bacterium]
MAQTPEHRASPRESQGAPEPAAAPAGPLSGHLDGLARRFDRQVRFAPFGRSGQANLVSARVLVVGCGALGGVLAETLFRAGVGELVLVDRDVVELSNLPRQILFDERHARAGTPKALAARETLERCGGPTRVTAHVLHLEARNLELVAADADLILDGTDNLETRYLLNDFALAHDVPWVYAGVVGSSGLVLPVLPGRSACLTCLFPDPPAPGALPTCDTAGVLLPAVLAVGAFAAGLGLRLLARPERELVPALLELDTWNGEARRLGVQRDPDCRTCARREFHWLERVGREAIALCGRNTVQVPARGARRAPPSRVPELAPSADEVQVHAELLRFRFEGCRISVFADGRALIEGTSDVEHAGALFARAFRRTDG